MSRLPLMNKPFGIGRSPRRTGSVTSLSPRPARSVVVGCRGRAVIAMDTIIGRFLTPLNSPRTIWRVRADVTTTRAGKFRMSVETVPHLRTAVRAFIQHYHEERPHQGLGNERIPPKLRRSAQSPVRCHVRLGGVLKFYYRDAA